MAWSFEFGILLLPVLCCCTQNAKSYNFDMSDLSLDFLASEGFLPGLENSVCRRDFNLFMYKRTDTLWARKMNDAYGNVPRDGMLEGSKYSLGHYHSCLEVNVQDFRGQYCSALAIMLPSAALVSNKDADSSLSPVLPPLANAPSGVNLLLNSIISKLGLCLPSSCSKDDIQMGLNRLTQTNANIMSGTYTFLVSDCTSKDTWPDLDTGDIFFIIVTCVFLVMVTVGTLYNSCNNKADKKSKRAAFLVGFSAKKNIQTLFDTNPQRGQITCINGIRFWSMAWVVVSHVYGQIPFLPAQNLKDVNSIFQDRFWFRVVMNGYLSVDSFFIITGCLLMFLTLKMLEKTNGKMNWVHFYLHRYIRITGVYAIIIGFFATLWKYFNFGPGSKLDAGVQACKDKWWRHLTYSNNFNYGAEASLSCVSQSWYLATEMQIFIFTPLLLMPTYLILKHYHKYLSLALGLTCLLLSTICTLSLATIREWPITLAVQMKGDEDFGQDGYYAPWIRCQAYIIGMILGYILHITKEEKVKLNKIFVVAMWLCTLAIGFGVVYGIDIYYYRTTHTEPELYIRVLYTGFHRVAWGLLVCWIIFACFHGYGGFVNDFLSWEGFIPLARMSFLVYLTHIQIMHVIEAQITAPIVFSHFCVVVIILNIVCWSYVAAFVFTVIFEMPLITCEKFLFNFIDKVTM